MAVPANVLSLCSGGGGLDLGLRLAVPDARTVCYVENEVTACGVLAARMEDERLDPAPIWTDLLTFDGKPWRRVVDWVIGGYPCQPFSNAGKRLGADDPRHLWPHVARIVAEVRPEFCFFENVGAHLRLGFREVARDLQGMGYTVAATLSTASEVGAPHGRERLFILAVADAERGSGSTEPREQHQTRTEVATAAGYSVDADTMGYTDITRLEGWGEPVFRSEYELPAWPPGPEDYDGWATILTSPSGLALAPAIPKSALCSVVNGLGRSDQLHILGNGVVPQQAAYALELLMTAIRETTECSVEDS